MGSRGRGALAWTATATVAAAVLAAGVLAAPSAARAETWTPEVENGAAQPVLDPAAVEVHDVWISTPVDTDHDGRLDEIHAKIYVPEIATGGTKVPTVVVASPYYAGTTNVPVHDPYRELWDPSQPKPEPTLGTWMRPGGQDTPPNPTPGDYWLSRGFAYALVATLGTADSDGCPQMLGRNEAEAMKAVVQWLANGEGTARLEDETPIEADWSSGRIGMTGVSYEGTLPLLAATTGVEGLEAIAPMAPVSSFYDYYRVGGGLYGPDGYQGEDLDNYVLALRRHDDTRCLRTALDFVAKVDRTTGDYNDFWDERNLRNWIDDVRTPTLIGHGMGDLNVRVGQSTSWYEALRERGVPTKLYLHQYGHVDVGDILGSDWQENLNRWFTRFLYEIDNGVEHEPTARIQREDRIWYDAPAWPAAGSAPVSLFPAAGGAERGGIDPGARAGAVEEQAYADDATKSLQTLLDTPASANRALYATAPLQQELHLSGTARAEVALSFNRPAANVTLAIVDRAPDGRSHIITRAWTDPQNRTDIRTTEAVVPGTSYDLSLTFVPVDYRVREGHSIELLFASSDTATSLLPQPGAVLTVDTSATRFELPVAGGDAAVQSALGAYASPVLSVSSASLATGGIQTVTGSGLAPDAALLVRTDRPGIPPLPVRTDAAGAFTAQLPITEAFGAGPATVTLTAGRASLATASFVVTQAHSSSEPATAPAAQLARSGADGDSAAAALLAAMTLAAGVALVAVRRARAVRRSRPGA